jgi:hypothetical protein
MQARVPAGETRSGPSCGQQASGGLECPGRDGGARSKFRLDAILSYESEQMTPPFKFAHSRETRPAEQLWFAPHQNVNRSPRRYTPGPPHSGTGASARGFDQRPIQPGRLLEPQCG